MNQVGRLAILALIVATVVLVGWPVLAGFSTTDTSQSATTSTTAPWCRALLSHMDNVRRLPAPEIRRVIVACDMTYTKECGAEGSVYQGHLIGSPATCVIKDKHGKVVRTYTTDSLRPTP